MAAKQAESEKTTPKATVQEEEATASRPPTAAEPVETVAKDVEANGDLVDKVVITGVIVMGAVLIEASLIPGIIIGAAAVLAPKVLPEIGTHLRPLFKATIRGAYKLNENTREAFAEAQENVQDLMAEVRYEDQEEAAAPQDRNRDRRSPPVKHEAPMPPAIRESW
jgi:Protein of unknown function (DUF5132)